MLVLIGRDTPVSSAAKRMEHIFDTARARNVKRCNRFITRKFIGLPQCFKSTANFGRGTCNLINLPGGHVNSAPRRDRFGPCHRERDPVSVFHLHQKIGEWRSWQGCCRLDVVISFPAKSRILEPGCGVGAQTITLARKSPDSRLISIDMSRESIVVARNRLISLVERLTEGELNLPVGDDWTISIALLSVHQ